MHIGFSQTRMYTGFSQTRMHTGFSQTRMYTVFSQTRMHTGLQDLVKLQQPFLLLVKTYDLQIYSFICVIKRQVEGLH